MRSKTSMKKCNCLHCQEKQEQVERASLYWSQVLEIKIKG